MNSKCDDSNPKPMELGGCRGGEDLRGVGVGEID